jgi:hypothetical protein
MGRDLHPALLLNWSKLSLINRFMMAHMLGPSNHFKIIHIVIKNISVNMMHLLVRFNATTDFLLGYEPMEIQPAPIFVIPGPNIIIHFSSHHFSYSVTINPPYGEDL